MDPIRDAIQRHLNECGEGWNVTQYVVAMGLQRMDSNGNIESTAWYYAPPDQADWHTTGLLHSAVELDEDAEVDD